jgi:hypothetical protein
MPLFVSTKDVVLRMQLSAELAGINDVVENGIIGAQLHVERVLGSKLVRQSLDCKFHLDADAFSGIQPGGMFRIEMPSGFIRTDKTVLITVTTDSKVFGTYSLADGSLLTIDYKRGYILMDASKFANQYVRVECDTGFEDGTRPYPTAGLPDYDADTLYVAGDRVQSNGVSFECVIATVGVPPEAVTKWKKLYVAMEALPVEVYEAVLSMVPVIFDASQTTNRNAEAVDQYKKSTDHAILVLQPYTRVKGFSYRSIT